MSDRSTLLDIAKATDPNGMPAKVIELLHQKNPIVQDAPVFPSNAPMGNRITVRSSLPAVSKGRINRGTARTKSATRQLVDTIGIFEARSEIDRKIMKTHGASAYAAERDRQDRAFQEALVQEVANEILYGDESVDEAGFTGLKERLDSLATAITGSQVRAPSVAPGGGDSTSMYIVDWGRDTVHLMYPEKGAGVAGLETRNLLDQPVLDDEGLPFQADVTLYEWFVGLTVKDPRHIARIANIDRSDANLASPTQGLLTDLLIDTLTAMPSAVGLSRVIYTHRDIEAAFWKQARNNASMVTIREWLGMPMPHFNGVPIRTLDQMSGAEDTVS